MNELLIRQLVEQTFYYGQEGDGIFTGQLDLEKFAELIVGHAIECVRDVLRDENSDLSYEGASQVQKHLREFFGVEDGPAECTNDTKIY